MHSHPLALPFATSLLLATALTGQSVWTVGPVGTASLGFRAIGTSGLATLQLAVPFASGPVPLLVR